MMRTIKAEDITETVKKLCIEANIYLGKDVEEAMAEAAQTEESPLGKDILGQLLENAKIAKTEGVPICQDTGFAFVALELGGDVHIDGNLYDAINEGVRQGYAEGYLRKSILWTPLSRKNTTDNTPAAIHLDLVPGDTLKITVAPKGGGSENMSTVKMLPPSAGEDGVVKTVVEWVRQAGGNPCPPLVIGVGLGGTFDVCAWLAKKALLRNLGTHNPEPELAKLEDRLLEAINKTGIGPQGLGGRTTALGVMVEAFPCHLASLPLAININCHAARHKTAVL
jgi:fumarate hydratase subunit alpha